MPSVSLKVNGKSVTREVEGRTLLVQLLREQLRPHRHPCRLRHQPVRRLHRPGRRQVGQELHHAGGRRPRAPTVTTIEGLAARRHAAPDAGGVPRAPRPAVRLLHARHGDERRRSRAAQPRTRASTRCATGWRATSAAAPATTTSSRPSRRRRERGDDAEAERMSDRRHRRFRQAQGGPPLPPRQGALHRRHQAAAARPTPYIVRSPHAHAQDQRRSTPRAALRSAGRARRLHRRRRRRRQVWAACPAAG